MAERIEVGGAAEEPTDGIRVGLVIDPNPDDEEGGDLSHVEEVIDRVLDPIFDKRWTTSGPPPWAGESYEIVIWIASAVGGGLLWDQTKRLGKALAQAAKEFSRYPTVVRLDVHALKLAAIAHALEQEPTLETDLELVGVIGDSTVDPTTWADGPGAFLFRIPCLATRTTFIVELNAFGEVLAIERRDYLPNDAGGAA